MAGAAGIVQRSTTQHAERSTRNAARSVVLVLLCGSLFVGGTARAGNDGPAEGQLSCASLRSMARIYMASGGYEKAQPFLQRALDLAQGQNDSDLEICACMLDLAYLYKSQGKLTEAERMCRSGLELQEKIYRENHPYVAYTLRILSEIYRGQARYQEAQSTLQRAIAIMQGARPDDDEQSAPFNVDMARLLVERGDLAGAQAYFDKAVSPIENSFGPEHLYTTKVLTSLAGLYVLQKRYADAERLTSRILPVQEEVYGPDHYLLVPVWLLISQIDQATGDLPSAKVLLDKSRKAVENQTDCGPLMKAEVLVRLGEFHLLSKDYARAGEVLQKVLNSLENTDGAPRHLAATALNDTARVCINQGRYTEAETLCHRALDILKTIFDEYHPSVADVLETQVQLHRQMGRTTEAAALEQQAQEIRARQHVAYTPMAKALP